MVRRHVLALWHGSVTGSGRGLLHRSLLAGAFVCALMGAGDHPAMAAGLDMTSSGSSGPVEVVADNGIEWQQAQRRFIARGNATATRGDVSVRADELYAYYADSAQKKASAAAGIPGGAGNIQRLEAHGAVRIQSPTENATGSDAVYDLTTGKMVLTNKTGRVKLVTQQETVTADDSLEYDVRTQVAVARGKAQLIQGKRVLHAAVLTAHLRTVGNKTELETVEATGGVVITTDKETARGSQGKYNAKTGIATLTGSVTLTRGKNILRGGLATVNMRTGVSTLTGTSSADGKARAILSPGEGAPGGDAE